MSWTTQAIELLREKWIKGVSAGDISKILARDLCISKTRNAVIGKVHRLGMGGLGRDKPAKPAVYRPAKAPRVRAVSKTRPPRPGPQNRPAVVHGTGCDFSDAPEVAEAKRAEYRSQGMSCVARVESGAGVLSLNARPFFEGSGCKWPLADGMRCCNPLARGPYCEGHGEVAYETTASLRTPLQVTAAARLLTRFDRIDLEPDGRVVHGLTGPHPKRDKAGPSIWDQGRAA